MGRPVLRTKLCDFLGIEYPILSAGMGPSLVGERTGAPVELVVAVSEAGGLGVLGAAGYTVDEMREAIREIKNGRPSRRQPVAETYRPHPLLQMQFAVDRPADVGKAFIYVGVRE